MLSDEDKRRIEAEEEYRQQVRAQTQIPRTTWNCLKCGFSKNADPGPDCPVCGNSILKYQPEVENKPNGSGCSTITIAVVLLLACLGIAFPPLLGVALVVGILAVIVKVLSK